MFCRIRNIIARRQIKKMIPEPDPLKELRNLMDAGFSQHQALTILNAIANMQPKKQ